MFNVSSSGIVRVNRGDSFFFPITLKIGSVMSGTNYTLQDSDVLYLGIMEPNQPFETAIIRKRVTNKDIDDFGNLFVRFWPEDTLHVSPGKYYYQIKLQTVDNETKKLDVETVVDKTLFYIQE